MNEQTALKIKLIKNKQCPVGYKNSPIGILPRQWKQYKLINIGVISTGLTPLRKKKEYFGGEIPWIKTGDLNNNYVVKSEENITQQAMKETSIKLVNANSILIAMYGGFNQIGRTGLLKIKATTNQAISTLAIDNLKYNSKYVLYWLNKNVEYWKRFAASSRKDPNITKKDVEAFPINLPSLEEQKKIADILTTWDKAIELKEKFVEEKKKKKNGLMQRLLTGKVRMPGFEEMFSQYKFGMLTKIIKGNQLNRLNMVENGRYPVINGGKLASGYTEDWNREANSITISEGGNSCGYVNLIKGKFWSGGHCYTVEIKDNSINKNYLYYYLKLNENEIMRFRVGSGLPNIQKGDLESFIIKMPSYKEQEFITDILITADKEIELLTKELEALKVQKKGLMQLLLTGIVRVNNDNKQ